MSKPKNAFSSVVRELIDGLRDGTVALAGDSDHVSATVRIAAEPDQSRMKIQDMRPQIHPAHEPRR
jgi:hypothetical protein